MTMDIVSLGGETAATDADHGFDAETFKKFISFDVGDGEPIYYHSVGKLYRQPGGEWSRHNATKDRLPWGIGHRATWQAWRHRPIAW